MTSVLQSIYDFIKKISIKDYQEESIVGSVNNIKEHLQSDECTLNVKRLFLNGSYIRHTILSPLDDIDVFAVIDEHDYFEQGKQPNPKTILAKFRDFLNNVPEYKDKVCQDRPCVTIHLSDKHIDVLPALQISGMLYIPNQDLNGWMFTDPETHNANFTELDKKYNKKFRRVVRAIKHWKRENEISIPSFHVEQIAMQIFEVNNLADEEFGILLWFEKAKLYLEKEIVGSDNKYQQVCAAIDNANKKLSQANSKKKSGYIAEAKRLWKEVFGSKFPVVDIEEAKTFGQAISNGSLKYSVAGGLSTTTGKTIAASKGFYGDLSESATEAE